MARGQDGEHQPIRRAVSREFLVEPNTLIEMSMVLPVEISHTVRLS